jgi:hypothetical protein
MIRDSALASDRTCRCDVHLEMKTQCEQCAVTRKDGPTASTTGATVPTFRRVIAASVPFVSQILVSKFFDIRILRGISRMMIPKIERGRGIPRFQLSSERSQVRRNRAPNFICGPKSTATLYPVVRTAQARMHSRTPPPEARPQYSPFSPGGRVFHRRCTHNHCSGYFLT